MAINGVFLPEEQSDFMDLIFQGEFSQAITALNAHPQLDVNFYTDHPSNTLQGISPLMMSCYFGEVALTQALILRGATVDAVCLAGRTPLHYAVMGAKSPTPTAREDLIHLLAYLKRDLLTIPDAYGNMPIHIGAMKERVQAVETLLNIESSLKFVKNTKHQKTPVEMIPSTSGASSPLRELLSFRAPSLEFLCSNQIAQTPSLRADQQMLPTLMQESVKLYTPMLTKWLANLSNASSSAEELAEKLQSLKIGAL